MGAVLVAAALLFLWLVRGILAPFAIALAVAAVLDPLLARLQRRGIPRIGSVAIVFALFFLAFAAFLTWLVPVLVSEAQSLARAWPDAVDSLRQLWPKLSQHHLVQRFNLPIPQSWSEISGRVGDYARNVGPQVLQRAVGGLSGTADALLKTVVVLISTFYLLKDWPQFRRRVHHIIPAEYRDGVVDVMDRVGAVFLGYLRGLVTLCLMYGCAVTLVLLALDRLPSIRVQYPFILGMVAALLYAVPYVGAALIAITSGVVTMVGSGNIVSGVIVVVAVLALNSGLFDPILSPKVLGRSTGLHPLATLFAMIAGSELLGFAGFIVGVPTAASIAIIATALYPPLGETIPPDEDSAVPADAGDEAAGSESSDG